MGNNKYKILTMKEFPITIMMRVIALHENNSSHNKYTSINYQMQYIYSLDIRK